MTPDRFRADDCDPPPDGGEPGPPAVLAMFASGGVTLAVLWWLWSGVWPLLALAFVGGLTACWLATLVAVCVAWWREGRAG